LSESLRTREEIPQEYKWQLEDIFSSDEEWENKFKETESMIALASGYKGRLAESTDLFLACMEWADKLSLNLEDLYTYARMRRDENNRSALYQGMTDRAGRLSVQAGGALSFLVPRS
jgi:oligoendopeptidase F